MEIVTITAAIAGLKNSYDLVKAAIAARDDVKLAEARQAVNDRIIDVQNAALALQEKQSAARDDIESLKESLRAANAKVAELEQMQAERGKYALHAISQGVHVYASKIDDAGASATSEPQHYICQPCFDGPEKRKVVLNYAPRQRAGVYSVPASWSCPVCKHSVSERE